MHSSLGGNVIEPDSAEKDVPSGMKNVQSLASNTSQVNPFKGCPRHSCTQRTVLFGCVKGKKCCILLDLGAQISCVSRDIVEPIQSYYPPGNMTIRGVGSVVSSALGKANVIVRLPENVPISYNFSVLRSEDMDYCIIFGMDLLSSFEFSIDLNTMSCRCPFGEWSFYESPLLPMGQRIFHQSMAIQQSLCVDLGEEDDLVGSSMLNRTAIRSMQRRNPQLRRLYAQIDQDGEWSPFLRKYRRWRNSIVVDQGLLWFKPSGDSDMVPLVTAAAIAEVGLILHYKVGHPGRQKLLDSMLTQGWHPSINQCASDITRSCERCQRMKVASVQKPPVTKIKTSIPFELVAVDLLKLPVTRGRFTYLLVAIDHFSKWLSVAPLQSKTTAAVCKAMNDRIFPSFVRVPIRILSDNGAEFISRDFKQLLESYGIRHTVTTPYKASSNGLVERSNRTILEALRLEESTDSWLDSIYRVVVRYNNSYHSEIKATPADYLLSVAHDVVPKPVVPLPEVELWREGNPSFSPFKVGQLVLRKQIFQGNNVTDKLKDRFVGPYKVVLRNRNRVTYVIEECQTGHRQRAHHSQLRRFYEPPPYLKRHPVYERLISDDPVSDEEQSDSPDIRTPLSVPGVVYPRGSSSSEDFLTSDSDDLGRELRSLHSSPQTSVGVHFDFLSFVSAGSVWQANLTQIAAAEKEDSEERANLSEIGAANNRFGVELPDTRLSDQIVPANVSEVALDWSFGDLIMDAASDEGDSLPEIRSLLGDIASENQVDTVVRIPEPDKDSFPVEKKGGESETQLQETTLMRKAAKESSYRLTFDEVPRNLKMQEPSTLDTRGLGRSLDTALDSRVPDSIGDPRSISWINQDLEALQLASMDYVDKLANSLRRSCFCDEAEILRNRRLAGSSKDRRVVQLLDLQWRLSNLQAASTKLSSDKLSPRVTRSMGGVPKYPNVQTGVLEYKLKAARK